MAFAVRRRQPGVDRGLHGWVHDPFEVATGALVCKHNRPELAPIEFVTFVKDF